MSKTLTHTLAHLFPEAESGAHAALAVSGLAADSRKVTPGAVFVAVPGTQTDGAAYIPAAVKAGAVAGTTPSPAG